MSKIAPRTGKLILLFLFITGWSVAVILGDSNTNQSINQQTKPEKAQSIEYSELANINV